MVSGNLVIAMEKANPIAHRLAAIRYCNPFHIHYTLLNARISNMESDPL